MQPCASFPVLLRGKAVLFSQYPAVCGMGAFFFLSLSLQTMTQGGSYTM